MPGAAVGDQRPDVPAQPVRSGVVALVGLPGAGKSTVGALLAERLGCAFLDVDAVIEAAAAMPVTEIFATRGEAEFRRLEADAARTALQPGSGRIVVALGGGALFRPETRAALGRVGAVVWLRAGHAALAARLPDGAGRPLLQADPSGTLTLLAAERDPLYAEAADVIVDTDDLDPDAVVARLVAMVDSRR